MVTVVLAAAPAGVTVEGAKLQVTPAGRLEQANETAWLKEFTGVTVTVADALPPGASERDAGAEAKEKSGEVTVAGFTVSFSAAEVLTALLASPE